MELTAATFALLAGVFFIAGTIKGVIGVGMPTVTLALLINFLPLSDGLALFVIPALVTNVWQASTGGHAIALLRRFWSMLFLLCVGTWIGVYMLASADQRLMSGIFGVVLMVYASISLFRPAPPPPGRAEPWLSPIIGFLNGIMNGLTGSYVIPGVLYLEALRLGRDVLIQTMGILFLTSTIALGVSLTGHGVMTPTHAALSAAGVIPAMLGYYWGQRWRFSLPEARFRLVFFIGLLCLGAYTAFTRLI